MPFGHPRRALLAGSAAFAALVLALLPAAAAHAVELPVAGVSGVVTDGTGATVEAADVAIYSASHSFATSSAADGSFALTGLPHGDYRISVDGPTSAYTGYFEPLTVAPGGTVVNPVLGLDSIIDGTVYLPDGVTPAEGILVQTYTLDGGGFSNGPDGTPASGEFSYSVRPGTYYVRYTPPAGSDLQYQWYANAPGQASASTFVAPVAGGGVFTADATLVARNVQLSGVVELDGSPVEDAGVIIRDASGNEVVTLFTEPDGTWLSAGLPAGPYTVAARYRDPVADEHYQAAPVEVVVGATDVTVADIAVVPSPPFFVTGVADAYQTPADTLLTVPLSSSVVVNDSMSEPGQIVVDLEAAPTHGDLFLQFDGAFRYAPDSDFTGTDTFTYSPGPEPGVGDPVTVTITVLPTLAATGRAPEVVPLAIALLALIAGAGFVVVSRRSAEA